MKIERGMLKLSLWPTTNKGGYWDPSDGTVAALHEIEEISGVDSSGAGPWHIIVEFDSIEEMTSRLPDVEARILAALNDRSARSAKVARLRP